MVNKTDIKKAWEKSPTIRGKNPETWRRDPKGSPIRKGSYGTLGDFGWEIDHIRPKSKGGSNSQKNFQALHWEANRKKGDKY